ncbi:bifunctional adenosylcobinamide kinase/adenosylcobinamide-phosphate guanylyltransferase [Mycoplasmatota bacterium WC44]
MIFILGGVYQGKVNWVKENYKLEFNKKESKDYELLNVNDNTIVINNIEYLTKNSHYELEIDKLLEWENNDSDRVVILIGNSIGRAVVPINEHERIFRDEVGFFYQRLIPKCFSVYRLWNGIEEKLK